MDKPINWTASTVAEALDLIQAVEERIKSGMKAAYPGQTARRLKAGERTPMTLRITFDPTELDRIADERSVFDQQVSEVPE
ncbi:hypothetical protein [Streptomyces sp. NPDC060001]|uniref:hypothetical protein n=1 Tax=Streptomyces sp. NPDC060001 TaxID=3347032 RepID=UPI003682E89F